MVKKWLLYLFTLLIIFSINIVNASENNILVDDIIIKDKSANIEVTDPKLSNFVTYELQLKNNNNIKYSIDSIKDNNKNQNISIEYDYDKNIEANFKGKIDIKIIYQKKLINEEKMDINDLDLEEEIVRLGYLLSEIRNTDKKYIKYNSLPRDEIGNEIRSLTNDIKKKIFQSSNDIKLSKDEINKSIEKLNDIFLDIDKKNTISSIGFESDFDNKMIKDKLEKSDNYILNAIVNHALYNYDYRKEKSIKKTNKITLNDVINGTAIIIYLNGGNKKFYKNRKVFRLKLLENYFIYGGYKNHDKLSNALRRLSKDSDLAAKQFYEMLSDKEYEK